MTNTDTRGFLTGDDRDFLKGRKEYTGETSAANTARRIRERGRQGFEDFALLFDRLGDEDRMELFYGKEGGLELEPELQENIRDTLAFIFHGMYVYQMFLPGDHTNHRVNEMLREAVEQVGNKEGFVVGDIDGLEIQATRVDIDGALEKARAGEKLSDAEKLALDREDLAEFVLKE